MISCHLHDFIEIACMYRYRVRLTLRDGSTLSGIAQDTAVESNQREVLKLETANGMVKIDQDDLESMQAVDSNPHFSSVDFR
jgi:Rho-binding antiterminator